MELSEKIQKLRKDRKLTQEELARQLFVSRTAVSKWETGRGIPSMESLQMIARYFDITLDELLGAEEIITLAKQENKGNIRRFAFCIDGILNIAALLGLLLPLYKAAEEGIYYCVPVYQFDGWLAAVYRFFPVAMAVCGAAQLLFRGNDGEKTNRYATAISVLINAFAVVLMILNAQPYPAVMFFVLLLMKGAVLLLKHK